MTGQQRLRQIVTAEMISVQLMHSGFCQGLVVFTMAPQQANDGARRSPLANRSGPQERRVQDAVEGAKVAPPGSPAVSAMVRLRPARLAS